MQWKRIPMGRAAASISVLACCLLLAVVGVSHAQQTTGFPEAAGSPNVPGGVGQSVQPLSNESSIPARSLLQVFRDGGILMLPIAICSVVLLVFVFERFISLRRGRIIPRPFVKRFLQQTRDGQLDASAALELCERNRSPIAEVFAAAVRKWGRPAVEVEQAIMDAGERVAHRLRKYFRVINGVSTISPLLGLLGTVLGMIRAFNAIATGDAMGRPEMLATGISQALLTTAAGMSVAIPALIAYLYFAGRVDQLIMDIDTQGQRLVEIISDDPQLSRASQSEGRSTTSRGKKKVA
jgi:biopolymer transport protein ExbB